MNIVSTEISGKNRPMLSICIPTYNRREFLKVCLESITSQFENVEIKNKVEIVISDNGSEDGTESLVKQFQEQFTNIRYIKSQKNMGFDFNVLQVVQNATGQYCWLLGDDDALFEKSLIFLLPLLEENKYDYLLANAWGYNRELTMPALARANFKISENQFYKTLKDFVVTLKKPQELVGTFGGMSTQIFKRVHWENLPEKEHFFGTQTIHLFVVLKALRDLPALIIEKPLVKTRADNMRWDSFPGLETITKRFSKTKETVEWINNLYGIKYSKFRLEAVFYLSIVYSYLYNFARRTVFRNQNFRNFLKRFLGK